MQPDQDVVNRWSKSAHFWEKHREVIRGMFEPVTRALIQDAEISGGETVLDIATGPGEPALSLAGVVGPAGKVCGIDPIPGMIEAARRAAGSLEVKNVQFEVAFADHLPFSAGTFDAVVSRFGAMFFPAPADAVRETLRVLKPGRKFALATCGIPPKKTLFTTSCQTFSIDTCPRRPRSPTPWMRFALPPRASC